MGLGVGNACPQKMLASGNGDRLGDGSCRAICLEYGLTVEANRPLSNGIGGVCGCTHRDVAWIHTWCGGLQPDAGYRASSVVISRFRSAASRTALPRISAKDGTAATDRSAAGAWVVATSAASGHPAAPGHDHDLQCKCERAKKQKKRPKREFVPVHAGLDADFPARSVKQMTLSGYPRLCLSS